MYQSKHLMKGIQKLNKAFSNTNVTKIVGWISGVMGIPWGFKATEENYNGYIKPWEVPLGYYPRFIKAHRVPAVEAYHSPRSSFSKNCEYALVAVREEEAENEYKVRKVEEYIDKRWVGKDCPKCGKVIKEGDIYGRDTTLVVEEPHWSFFFEATSCLTEFGFKRLRNAFHSWGLDICMKAVTVMSGLVSPQTYDEVVKLLSKEKTGERDEDLLAKRE